MVAMRERKTSIPRLRRHLLELGHSDVPSEDTLARLVDELYTETGEPAFRRAKRSRQKT